MGLLERLKTELVDIVEWIDDPGSILVWRFPRHHNQIKNGARLIVRPGQLAIFVHQGRLADVFEPGTHVLATRNLPILSTLLGWPHGFESPFKAEVYFVSTRQLTGLKWGTPNPVMLRDADFGPVRLRAFGTYNLRATDPRALLTELVGTEGVFEAGEITELMRSLIASSFADLLASSEIAALDLAARYQELSDELRQRVIERVDDEYGLDVPQLFIVNISFPPEVEKALDTRASMGVVGDVGRFQQYQMGLAATAAAENPAGGGAAEGVGLGVGFALANQLARGPAPGAAAGPAPPPPPQHLWYVAEGGRSLGPFAAPQLAQLAAAGRLTAATMVWRAGMAGWQSAGEVAELAALTAPPPPPPPG